MVGLQLTNSSGAAVPFTAIINNVGTEIFITPSTILTNNQAYYVSLAANAVIDYSGNPNAATNATFTTHS